MGKRRTLALTLATAGVMVTALAGTPAAKPAPPPPPPTQPDGTWEVNLTATLSTCSKIPIGTIRLTTWKIAATKAGWQVTTDGKKQPGHTHTWTGVDRKGAVVLDAGTASSGELRVGNDSISGTLVEIVSGRPPCAVVYRVYGIPPAPATQPLAANPLPSGLPSTGVPECDAYLGHMMACMDQMPSMTASSREQMKKAMTQAAEQMAKANPAADPNVAQSMAKACTQAVDAARKAYQQLGCSF